MDYALACEVWHFFGYVARDIREGDLDLLLATTNFPKQPKQRIINKKLDIPVRPPLLKRHELPKKSHKAGNLKQFSLPHKLFDF